MKLIVDAVKDKYYLVSLGFSTVVYFAAIRVFQDLLYHWMGIDVRPLELFDSFGPFFTRPEPFEVILYIVGYAMVPVIAYFFVPLIRTIIAHKKAVLYLAAFIVVVGIVVVATKFPFDRYIEYIQTRELSHVFWFATTKRIIVVYSVLLASVVFGGMYYFFQPKGRSFFYSEKGENFFKKTWPAGVAILAVLMFHPNIPIDAHHYHYFLGAVHDITHAKGLLYETSHLYGLFNIYFLVGFFKLVPLSYPAFSVLIMGVYFIFLSAIGVFLKKWLRSYTLAILGTMVVAAFIYFYQTSPTRSALFFPAMSPFRWGLYVPVLFLMLAYERSKKTKYLHWSYALAAFSLFWNFDSGLFLSAAVLITAGYIRLSNHWDIKGIIKEGVYYVGYVVSFFAITNVVNKLIYGTWPHWGLFFRESKYFSQGIAMYPLPVIGVYEVLFVSYLIVLLFALYRLVKQKSFNIPLLFLTLYGVFSFVYYIGESSWQIIYVVTVPWILVLFFGLHTILKDSRLLLYHRLARTGLMTLLFFGGLLLVYKIPVEFAARDYGEFRNTLTEIQPEEQETYQDAQYIKQHYPQARIPVMSLNDTKLFLYSDKVNYFDFYYIFTIYFRPEMERYVDQTLIEKLPVVFIGTGEWRNDQVEYFREGIQEEYRVVTSLATVDIYELKEE